jgi:hypothetical protein
MVIARGSALMSLPGVGPAERSFDRPRNIVLVER